MKPETAIASWQQWSGHLPGKPEIIQRLDGGLSNQSYLLDAGGTRLVLRLNNESTLLPGANRRAEAQIWKVASEEGIAPPLIYVDEQAGFLVSTFIETNVPPLAQTSDAVLDQVFSLMSQCHNLDVEVPVLDYEQHIERYWEIIDKDSLSPTDSLVRQRGPMRELLESLLENSSQKGLCHHDPVQANFVGTPNRLYLIDWEFAAKGLLVMDYAALAVEWKISDETVLTKSGVNPELLTMAKKLYIYLCQLWQQATT